MTTPDLVALIQERLRAEYAADPSFYRPSPGQLVDHVHSRVARVAAEVAVAASKDAYVHGGTGVLGLTMLTSTELARRHLEHYRVCNCLGDAALCCDVSCPCHELGV